jgi:RNA polymerase sigma factor (sigma-70 family)
LLPSTQISGQESRIASLLRQGDDTALDLIYENYADAIYGVLNKILPTEAQAQDALQVTMEKVWKNAQSYDAAKGRLFTWLINIARNTAFDELKSKNQQKSNANLPLEKVQGFVENRDQVHLQHDHLGIKKVLQKLNNEQQKLIHMAYFQGFTQSEIAKEIPMPLGTVKTKLRNAIIELRNLMLN